MNKLEIGKSSTRYKLIMKLISYSVSLIIILGVILNIKQMTLFTTIVIATTWYITSRWPYLLANETDEIRFEDELFIVKYGYKNQIYKFSTSIHNVEDVFITNSLLKSDYNSNIYFNLSDDEIQQICLGKLKKCTQEKAITFRLKSGELYQHQASRGYSTLLKKDFLNIKNYLKQYHIDNNQFPSVVSDSRQVNDKNGLLKKAKIDDFEGTKIKFYIWLLILSTIYILLTLSVKLPLAVFFIFWIYCQERMHMYNKQLPSDMDHNLKSN